MLHTRFLEPVDVLFLRGNRLFGEPGSYGESLLPPWPSVPAGALRSHVYARTGEVLDRADQFRLTAFHVARRINGRIEPLYGVPADLSITGTDGQRHASQLLPVALDCAVQGSFPLAMVPVLAQDKQIKPVTGCWITSQGWQQYLAGKTPAANHLIPSTELWEQDDRVGIGMDGRTRSAQDKKLFSMQAVALRPNVGFLVSFTSTHDIGRSGVLRFGGDGRGIALHPADVNALPSADLDAIAASAKARIVLTTPGLFADGWRLPGMAAGGAWQLGGLRGRVVAAAVPRAHVISGWDLLKRQPKPAQHVAPTGSVYWLDDLQGTPDALRKLAVHGLWPDGADNDPRRIEGYNRFHFAAA